MTDWDLVVEYIQRTMETVDKAHEALMNYRKTPPLKTWTSSGWSSMN